MARQGSLKVGFDIRAIQLLGELRVELTGLLDLIPDYLPERTAIEDRIDTILNRIADCTDVKFVSETANNERAES